MYVHIHLEEERTRLRKTQEEMAALGGVKLRTYANYAAGDRVPDASFLAAIADAGADVLYILTGERAQPPLVVNGERAAYNAGLSPEESALLDNYRHAGEAGRKAIREVGAALAQCAGDERREG